MQAHLGYVILTSSTFVATIGGVLLVDRKGRKFLLSLGSAGIIVSLLCVGIVFHQTEKQRVDVKDAVQAMVDRQSNAHATFNEETATNLSRRPTRNPTGASLNSSTLVVIYSYGDFHGATAAVRSDDTTAKPIEITRDSCVPPNKVVASFSKSVCRSRRARNRAVEN